MVVLFILAMFISTLIVFIPSILLLVAAGTFLITTYGTLGTIIFFAIIIIAVCGLFAWCFWWDRKYKALRKK